MSSIRLHTDVNEVSQVALNEIHGGILKHARRSGRSGGQALSIGDEMLRTQTLKLSRILKSKNEIQNPF